MHLNSAVISDDVMKDTKLKIEFIRINSNLKNVLHSISFCGICLDSTPEMFHMDNFLRFNDDFKPCTTQQMVWELFNKTEASNFPSKYVCEACCNDLIHAYMFMVKARNSSKVLNSYLDQINSQIDDVETTVRKSDKTEVENAIIMLKDKFTNQIAPKEELLCTSDDDWSSYESDDDDGEFKVCYHCSETFTNKKSLRIHIKRYHCKKTQDKCTECMADHCAHSKYLNDINDQIKNGSNVLKCLDCEYTCAKKNSLIAHVNKEHLKIFAHLCESCGQNFHSKVMLSNHTKKYHSREYVCEYCDLQFKDNPSLVQHIVECKLVEREFKCTKCPASFDTIQKLNKHSEKHKKISCSLCSKKVKNEHFLRRHMHYAHLADYIKKDPQVRDNRPRLCSVCPAVLHSLTELKDHLNSHDPAEKHHCSVCIKEFNTRKEYNIHVSSLTHVRRTNPNAEFNFKCANCPYTSKNKVMMENHQNTFHLKVKPYQCKICSKKFTTQLNLKYHEDRHTEVKRFQCNLCSNLFTSGQGLKKHILRHHSERRPIPCDSCDKTFVCQSELNLHKQRNHTEKSIPCPLCGVKFSSRANIRAHNFQVHFKSKDQFEEFMTSENVTKEFYEMFRDHRLNF